MSLNTRLLSRHGLAAALTAAAALATAGVAWSATTTSAATATTTTGTTVRASAAPRTCALNDLYVSMGHKEGAAGSLYWSVQFTNTSTTPCALRGYPGVSVLDTAHRQIGPAAAHSGTSYSTVALGPGHSASAVARTTNGPIGGPCLRTGSYLRIYPPASHTAVLVPARWTTCSNSFQVGPINTEGTF
ncbi:hypothetical protein J2Z21_001457 [Streptomyces griseochromogenes]|uniref:DUF4232 domain-containing protein n=1 Tax=Streptomyces griseochromogenes TaxID=68214 RepID=A0A1B1B7V9_9ACTN|nr:DUF4232 domain-containing protein [Streptomyces griseochromogenes]ANP54883.1 hypothetical protein AVL59_39540 [Streptomyces griseochromogenes]MBP2048532.1 hypothetical protein [Streptomyces griseochromogenes]